MNPWRWTAPLALAVLVTACGGSDDDEGVGDGSAGGGTDNGGAVSGIPASALASVAAFAGFLNALTGSETAEPLDLASATPPTSDTEEPIPLR